MCIRDSSLLSSLPPLGLWLLLCLSSSSFRSSFSLCSSLMSNLFSPRSRALRGCARLSCGSSRESPRARLKPVARAHTTATATATAIATVVQTGDRDRDRDSDTTQAHRHRHDQHLARQKTACPPSSSTRCK
eukprot:1120664-Rhodomonas_salina.1